MISVTSPLGCQRGTFLERTTEDAEHPMKMWWSLRSSLIQKLVEREDTEHRFSERQLKTALDGIPLVGRIDSYQVRFLQYGILKDWKSIGDNGLQ